MNLNMLEIGVKNKEELTINNLSFHPAAKKLYDNQKLRLASASELCIFLVEASKILKKNLLNEDNFKKYEATVDCKETLDFLISIGLQKGTTEIFLYDNDEVLDITSKLAECLDDKELEDFRQKYIFYVLNIGKP